MYLFHRKERVLVIAFLLIVVAIAIYLGWHSSLFPEQQQNKQQTKVEKNKAQKLLIGETTISVELADSNSEIRRGLSFRDSLGETEGMYFVLPQRQQISFWMYEMRFPLDIIWIDTGQVVGIEKNAPIPSGKEIPTFRAPQPITNVLEVKAGFSDLNNIQIGDRVTLL